MLARHLLLLAIATDWELPVRQRAAVWLEVFGNALLQVRFSSSLAVRTVSYLSASQARTAAYVASKRGGLIDLVCNGRGPQPLASVLDTSLLKVRDGCTPHPMLLWASAPLPPLPFALPSAQHRQRDDIEEALQGYAESAPFDMAGLRDQRCVRASPARCRRRHGGALSPPSQAAPPLRDALRLPRQPRRLGLHVARQVVQREHPLAPVPCVRCGRLSHRGGWHLGYPDAPCAGHWRNTGVAFELGDQVYSAPNRSLASYAEGARGRAHAA